MHDFAKRAVFLDAQLPFDANVLSTDWAQPLDHRLGIELCVLQTGHEAVAAFAHAAHLRAVQSEVELVLVRLRNAYNQARQRRG